MKNPIQIDRNSTERYLFLLYWSTGTSNHKPYRQASCSSWFLSFRNEPINQFIACSIVYIGTGSGQNGVYKEAVSPYPRSINSSAGQVTFISSLLFLSFFLSLLFSCFLLAVQRCITVLSFSLPFWGLLAPSKLGQKKKKPTLRWTGRSARLMAAHNKRVPLLLMPIGDGFIRPKTPPTATLGW